MTRASWKAALRLYYQAKEAHELACAAYNKAEQAAFDELSRNEAFADLHVGWSRERVLEKLHIGVAIKAAKAAEAGAPLTDAEIEAMQADTPRVADEFAAYQKHHREAMIRHRVEELNAECDVACDAYCEARKALLATPAPDIEALVAKLEVVAEYDDNDELGAHEALADARRLVGQAVTEPALG